MATLQLLTLITIITAYSTFGRPNEDVQELTQCPKIKPFTNVNTDQVNTKFDK